MSSLYQSSPGLLKSAAVRRGHPVTNEGRWSVRLVASGIVLIALARLGFALSGIQASVGPLPLHGMVALVGILAVLQGGILAIIAILRRKERSVYVFATLPLWAIPVVFVLADLVA